MNSSPLLLVPLASLALLTADETTTPANPAHDLEAMLAQLDAASVPAATLHDAALQGLTTRALQSASGLHSAARGLTPKEDWQRLFPRYSKRD